MKRPNEEARRWLAQAEDDLQFARWLLSEQRGFDKGCFIAQQAAEKALKAILYRDGARTVLGHSAADLLARVSSTRPDFIRFEDDARQIDRFYIPTRYPNGLPGGTPFENYTLKDLEKALAMAGSIVEAAGVLLRETGQ